MFLADADDVTKKLFIKTYGCQMNVYDSDRMAHSLASHGYEPATGPDDADLVILNTCHIREKAAEKVFSELGRLRRVRDARAGSDGARDGAGGCRLRRPGRRASCWSSEHLSSTSLSGRRPIIACPRCWRAGRARPGPWWTPISRLKASSTTCLGDRLAGGVSAFLTIQEGCDKFCTFCVVPYTRGAEQSRARRRHLARGAWLGGGRGARDHPARSKRQRVSRRRPGRRDVGPCSPVADPGRDP